MCGEENSRVAEGGKWLRDCEGTETWNRAVKKTGHDMFPK